MTKRANNLTFDAKRLWSDLMETARISCTTKGGIRRLTLGEVDRCVRDWFRAECESFGCAVHVDDVGYMFAIGPGRNNALRPIAMGSYLDTQPTGGKFDDVLGRLAGLECLPTCTPPTTRSMRRSCS